MPSWHWTLYSTLLRNSPDISTDGIWCYILLWVVPHSTLLAMRWSNLKDRLQEICPPCIASFYFNQQPTRSSPVYLLKFCCPDRKGLLHGNRELIYMIRPFILYLCVCDCMLIYCFYFVRCYASPLWARTYNSKGESDNNSRWQSLGPLFHNR